MDVFTFLSILLIYWFPFYTVFSLFKNVSSYWYRYSYINIFGILFVAAVFYLTVLEQENTCILVKAVLFFALLMFLLRRRLTDRKSLQETVLIILAALLTGVVFFFASAILQTAAQTLQATLISCGCGSFFWVRPLIIPSS